MTQPDRNVSLIFQKRKQVQSKHLSKLTQHGRDRDSEVPHGVGVGGSDTEGCSRLVSKGEHPEIQISSLQVACYPTCTRSWASQVGSARVSLHRPRPTLCVLLPADRSLPTTRPPFRAAGGRGRALAVAAIALGAALGRTRAQEHSNGAGSCRKGHCFQRRRPPWQPFPGVPEAGPAAA